MAWAGISDHHSKDTFLIKSAFPMRNHQVPARALQVKSSISPLARITALSAWELPCFNEGPDTGLSATVIALLVTALINTVFKLSHVLHDEND